MTATHFSGMQCSSSIEKINEINLSKIADVVLGYTLDYRKSYMVVLSDRRSDRNGKFLTIEIHKGGCPVGKIK
uniref:PRC domain-containing protein n=1 Tax=Strongyloides venezuelensis TaxID=75913 RepID=A0A0K0FJX9_STRVS